MTLRWNVDTRGLLASAALVAGCASAHTFEDAAADDAAGADCAAAGLACTDHQVCDVSTGQPQCISDGWGFFSEDPGLGPTRTIYDLEDEGTAANPLTFDPCIYHQPDPILIDPPGCHPSPGVFPQSNAWTSEASWPTDDYWLLLMNNEPAFDACNLGPPDASLPRAEPGMGIMGFSILTLPGESFARAHLVLNNTFANPCGTGGIPFLSFGAHQHRGNHGQPILAIHPSDGPGRGPDHLAFVAKLWDLIVVDGDVGASYLWLLTEWARADGTVVPRILFVALGSQSKIPSWNVAGVHRHWNWPVGEDILRPGADIAFLDVATAAQSCGITVGTLFSDVDIEKGRELAYDLDVSALFDCASQLALFDEPVPAARDIPVRGVFFANEVARTGSAVWTSVHGLRTHR